MRLFDSLDKTSLKETWAQKDNQELSYYGGKVPAFTPAVQGQDPGIDPASGIQHFAALHNVFCNWEYTGWMDECSAIHTTGYIGDWSWLYKVRLTGPDTIKCLEASTINGFKNFPVGRGRHIVSVLPNGKMIGDGIAFREAENQVLITGGAMVMPGCMLHPEGFNVNVEIVSGELYNFHVQGPVSRTVLEKLIGESIEDLPFITFKEVTIAGRKVRLYRGGMSGEIGYELFGDSADGSVIWNAVVEAGKEFGLRQLGLRSLMLNHLQAFFPTIWVDFIPAIIPEAAPLHRYPTDYGWGKLIDKTREFPGKEILMKEMENPTGRTMTLEWNDEDVKNIFTSLFDADQEPFELPSLPVNTSDFSSASDSFLPVFAMDQKMIGFASNRGYSMQYRKFLSHAQLDIAYAKEGTEVLVLYGKEGQRQTMIRARVAQTPYKTDRRK